MSAGYIRFKIALRRRLSEAQNHRCCYCGCHMNDDPTRPDGATLEHYQCQTHGGQTTYENCLVACKTCNFRRGRKHPKKFFAALRNSWWSSVAQMVAA
jgi:predicted restriction endonuclease